MLSFSKQHPSIDFRHHKAKNKPKDSSGSFSIVWFRSGVGGWGHSFSNSDQECFGYSDDHVWSVMLGCVFTRFFHATVPKPPRLVQCSLAWHQQENEASGAVSLCQVLITSLFSVPDHQGLPKRKGKANTKKMTIYVPHYTLKIRIGKQSRKYNSFLHLK